jgi:hypothetical protein
MEVLPLGSLSSHFQLHLVFFETTIKGGMRSDSKPSPQARTLFLCKKNENSSRNHNSKQKIKQEESQANSLRKEIPNR